MNSSESILVIDDDEAFRSRLAKAFRVRGFNVSEASNCKEARTKAMYSQPNMAVLDLKLGNESGLVLLKELLQIKNSMKIVVLTGYGTISTAVDAVKLGAANYISKPVDADAVLAAFDMKTSSAPIQIEVPHLDQVEWDHIQRVVNDCGGNITQASKALGMHRRSLQRKLAKNPLHLK